MYTDLIIEVVVLAEKQGGASKIVYRSDFVPVGQTMDLYVSEESRLIALYHHAAYADPVLAERHRTNQMVYPGRAHEKLILVGRVHGTIEGDAQMQVEVSRAPLRLKAIPVDER